MWIEIAFGRRQFHQIRKIHAGTNAGQTDSCHHAAVDIETAGICLRLALELDPDLGAAKMLRAELSTGSGASPSDEYERQRALAGDAGTPEVKHWHLLAAADIAGMVHVWQLRS